jgi:hypothetical protein
LTTFPTLMTSVGLTMPSAFTVTNSPLTGAGGTLAVTGAGVASQYIRGDGTLADFPSSGGGGSSVSYYLNGGTSQGTIGGTTYYEMSKTAVIGTGVDFAKSGDGFIVAFLTDANDPAQLNIPAGNWNYEIYASMSSNGGTPQMYAELYVYDGTTFTLIATSSNEIIYDGTALNLYTFAMAVPATSLTLTDRLAVKLYATNSGGKTTTIHTQDGHLCQIITTFSTGITALNGLTAQVQYFQVGTSGTDFNISSTTATHTFNIPSASATNRGLITTGTQTIAGSKTFTATLYGTDSEFSGSVLSPIFSVINGTKVVNLQSLATLNRDIYLPDASGTIALTSALANYVDLTTAQTIGGTKTFNDATKNNGGIFLQNASSSSLAGYMNLGGLTNGVKFTSGGGVSNTFTLPSATGYTFTFPNATGTLALTSDIPVNPITGTGTSGQVAYFNGTNSITGESNLFWDATNDRLGIGTNTPVDAIEILGYNKSIKLNGASNDRSAWLISNSIGTGELYLFNGNNTNTVFLTGNGVSFLNGGNVLINTVTDAGFRLDVNGTARVQGDSIITTATNPTLSINSTGGGTTQYGTLYLSNANTGSNSQLGQVSFGAGSSTTAAAIKSNIRGGGNIGDLSFWTGANASQRSFQLSQADSQGVKGSGFGYLGNLELSNFTIGSALANLILFSGTTANNTGNSMEIQGSAAGGTTVTLGRFSAVKTTNTLATYTSDVYVSNGQNGSVVEGWRLFGSGNMGINANATDISSAVLFANSTTKGFLPPRMTTAQRTAISSPAEGLIVVQTDGTQGLYLYIGAAWHSITML